MASTFTLKSASYDGRYLELTCTQTKNVAENTSTINWVLKSTGGSSNYYSVGATTVKINNTQAYYKERVGYSSKVFPAAKGETSGSMVVKHNNDGSLTIPVSLATAIYSTSVSTVSGNWVLDAITRQATITAAPNFTDEENPTVTFSNPSGSKVDSLAICITLNGDNADIAYKSISKTATSYTFNLTNAERNVLRNATTTSNSRSVRFYLRTIIDGNIYYSKITKTLTIVNANPVCNPTVKDIGGNSITYTGDAANKMIKGYNVMAVTFGVSALKGATITSKKVTCGGKSLTADGNFVNAESGDFVFTVTDSRGNTTTKTIKKTVINYKKLTCGLSETKFTTDGVISFKIYGNYWKGSFGAVSNTLLVKYRCYEVGASPVWQTTTATINSDGTYTANVSVSGLDYRKKYVILAYASDKVHNVDNNTHIETPSKTMSCVPVFDWSETDFNFNVPVSINGKELDYIVEQGEKDGWSYRKWNSGLGECWKVVTFTATITNTVGSMYYSNAMLNRQDYPFPFTSKPMENVTVACGGGMGWAYNTTQGVNGTHASGIYGIISPVVRSEAQTYYVSFDVKGKWK